MRFSVLMSVYKNDNEIFFREALESVTIYQTLKPSQVVIVQDGPVSNEINNIISEIEELERNIEFTRLVKDINEGLAKALNDGIDACKYEWIARMDSDDISLPDRFEKQINFIKKNGNIDVLGGIISEFDIKPGDLKSERHVGKNNEEIIKMAKKRTPMNHVTVMYKKSKIIDVGKYTENFGKLEDYKLWVDMISIKANMANLDNILVYVRIGNGFISRRSNKQEIKDWDRLQEYLKRNGVINCFELFLNRMYIRIFTYMPSFMKEIAYKLILR